MKRRNTPARQEVLSLLENAIGAMSQDMIESQMTLEADRVTIYRLLNKFCEDGIAHKIVAEDGKSYFALCAGNCNHSKHHHDHFHFKCSKCGNIECLKDTISLTLPKGYKVENTNCIVTGICSTCNQ